MVFLPIPEFERYLISSNGAVIDSVEEEIIMHRNDVREDTKVKLLLKDRTNRYRSTSVARLVLITHKPLENVSLKTVWAPKLIILDQKVSVENLDYDFGEYDPPTVVDKTEFYPVPTENINLEINYLGEVKVLGKIVNSKIIKGYRVVSLTNANGTTRYIGLYRLLGITFLRRPINYSDLVVNHKDGDCLNDEVGNLEWTTYYGNIIHAHENSLVTQHNPVEVLNISTGVISNFFSIGAFSRFYNLSKREIKRVEFRMRMFGAINNYRGFSIRLNKFPIKWENIANVDKYQGNAKEVTAVDTVTGKVHEFLWFKDAAEFLELSHFKLREALRKYGTIKVGNYLASYYLPDILAGNTMMSET